MKRKLTTLILAVSSVFAANAQVMLFEDFTSPFNPATNGWERINNSLDANGTWVQGTGTVFPAFSGAANDYYSTNWAATSSTLTNATISNWLITPTVVLVNGAVLQFATRTTTNPTTFPDRLEVYMSQGTGTNVGTTPTSLGTFSTLLVSINPGLTTTGYPGGWTIITATVTGVPLPVQGRLGFRYHVTSGGTNGQNSNYIGIDAVIYHNPCTPAPSIGIATSNSLLCQGTSSAAVSYTGTGGLTYLWVVGTVGLQNSTLGLNVLAPTINTPPTRTIAIDVYGVNASGCLGKATQITTISLNPTVSVSGATVVCVNQAAPLNVVGTAGSTFSWTNGGTGATTNYSNTVAGNYTVTATATNTDGCKVAASAITVTVDACTGIQKIDENTLNSSFYPNPFAQQLKVSGFSGVVELFNTTGQLVIRTAVNGSATIETADLPKGVYFVQGYNTNGELTVTEKLIKH